MCRGGWLVLLVWATGAPALTGQRLERVPAGRDRPAERQRLEELRARADSLLREWRRANAIADLVDSVDRTRAGAATDTIGVGSLRIVTNPSPLPLREAAARAWAVIDSTYGPEARHLEQRPVFLRAVDPDTSVQHPLLRGTLIVPWDVDATALALLLLSRVQPPEADSAFKTWLGALARPLTRPERHRARVYVELLRSVPGATLPRPASQNARETLVHLALRLGGREAYRRLLASSDAPVADRLAEAAGVRIDSLLTRWRAEILASRPV